MPKGYECEEDDHSVNNKKLGSMTDMQIVGHNAQGL